MVCDVVALLWQVHLFSSSRDSVAQSSFSHAFVSHDVQFLGGFKSLRHVSVVACCRVLSRVVEWFPQAFLMCVITVVMLKDEARGIHWNAVMVGVGGPLSLHYAIWHLCFPNATVADVAEELFSGSLLPRFSNPYIS